VHGYRIVFYYFTYLSVFYHLAIARQLKVRSNCVFMSPSDFPILSRAPFNSLLFAGRDVDVVVVGLGVVKMAGCLRAYHKMSPEHDITAICHTYSTRAGGPTVL
jgi:hypothetical protein